MIASLTALAQGKITVINDGASLVVLSTDTGGPISPADVVFAGQPVGNATPLPSGVVLMAGLYGGTSSTALFYYPPNVPSNALLDNPAAAAGSIGPFQVQLKANAAAGAPAIPGITSGTPIGASTPWFQVRVWDSAYATFAAALAAGRYAGEGSMFQMNPGSSLTYTFTAPSGPDSRWTDGSIYVPILNIPEPSMLSLVALGAATLVISRRRG